jgi:putative ABC transport system permease protein
LKTGRLARVTWLNVRRDRRGFALSAGGVAVGVAAFVYFVGLGEGVGAVVRDRIFPVETTHLKVIPPRVALGAFLGGGVLDDDAVGRLEALPGVVGAHRQMELTVPAVSRYDGDFFGRRIRMGVDVIGVGVDSAYLEDHLPAGARFDDPGEEAWLDEADVEGAITVPVVVSRRLLELYNTTFAPARGLPRIGDAQLLGFRFPLTLGASYVARPGGGIQRRTVMLEVVGLSDRAMLLGVTFPLETVRRWNAGSGSDGDGPHYSAVVLVADGPERVQPLMAAVRAAGFDVDQTEQRMAEEIGAAVTVTTLALSLLSFLILGLAAVNIARAAYAHVAARTREIGVMRAVGATRGDVAAIVVSESAAAGFAGGVVGVLLALAGAFATDLAAGRFVPDLPFKPETFFLFPAWLPAVAVGAALASAVLGALLPAATAARLDPVRALSGGS